MTDPTPQTPTRDEAVPTGWRYSINYGPDGEQNFANVYGADGQFVGNLRTHHAIAICNAFAVCEKLASTPAPASGGVREAMETQGPYEAWFCKDTPADCCDYGVVSLSERREVCRAWREQDARAIAAALAKPATSDDWNTIARRMQRAGAPGTEEELEHALRAALSPAATPVSGADMIPRAKNVGRYLAETNDGRLLYLNHATEWQEMPNILAKPASSPAGGDVVQTLIDKTEKLIEAADDMGWSCNSSSADQAIREAKDAVRAALSQSTSAGRVGDGS